MEILFNNENKGTSELKDILGFVATDYRIKNLKTDVEQATHDLLYLIGDNMYNKLVEYYSASPPSDTAATTEQLAYDRNIELVRLAQIPVLSFALIAYENNLDVSHAGNGRPATTKEGDRIAWRWQQEKDEAATRRRAYKALDMLIEALDKSGLTEWTDSDEYKKSKDLIIHTTRQFQEAWPIFNSRQLLLRFRPIMEKCERNFIKALLGREKYTAIKTAIASNTDPEPIELTDILPEIRKTIAYYTLADAYEILPVEMFPGNMVQYSEKSTAEANARHEKIAYFRKCFTDEKDNLVCLIKALNNDNTLRPVTPKNCASNKYLSM